MFSQGKGWPQVRKFIVTGTIAYLAGAVVISLFESTPDLRWLVFYTRVAGTLLLALFTAAAVAFSYRVTHAFSPGEPLLPGWRLIALSAALDLVATLLVQVLGTESILNPLTGRAWWPRLASDVRAWGLFLGGPCRFAFLSAGLLFALEVYRRSGLLGRLMIRDRIVLALMTVYVLTEAWAVVVAIQHGKRPELWEVLHYPTDPLLLVLLGQAMLLHRSAAEMGAGWVGSCWNAFGGAIVLTVAGDLLDLAANYSYIPWPWSAIGWFIWIPAAAVFAAAPTYQLQAIELAQNSRVGWQKG